MTSAARPYTPRFGSLAERALEFFRNNPEEKLTVGYVAVKFDHRQLSVYQCLMPAVHAGLLAKGRNAAGQVVYRLPDLLTRGAAA